jgi:molybdate transport repressor ModE-like protein
MHNKQLSISPAWIFQTETDEFFEPVLLHLLENIRASGKLTHAAAAVGISYRHAWNLLKRGADIFGLPLVEMRKGQGSRLSSLGEKLLWTDQRVKARLGPQLESMASELNDQIRQLIAGTQPMLRIHASHGYAVALLAEFSDQVKINLQYRNPEEALSALNRGECDLASFHVPTDPLLARQILSHYQHLLADNQHQLIRLVIRNEGLMLRKGSYDNIHTLQDLSTAQLSFIGRDNRSGTRLLLNLLLQQQGLTEDSINRTSQQEYTHTAIAAFVASGMADAGFGVKTAADQFDLRFIELASEHYLLLFRKDQLSSEALAPLLEVIRSQPFIDRIHEVSGYAPDNPGDITTFEQLIAEDA